MQFRCLLFALLPALASAQGLLPPREPWTLADPTARRLLPAPRRSSVDLSIPSATVVVEGDYPPLFTEREIRFLEFRAALLRDLQIHLETFAPSETGALVPARYGVNGQPRVYSFGGSRWKRSSGS